MDKILILDFGGQYDLLIARRVRSQQVYAEIKPYNAVTADDITSAGYKGIIFTGGPNSVYDETSPHIDKKVLELGIPVLGICYGQQLMAYTAGGAVAPSNAGSEYGKSVLYAEDCALLEKVPSESVCWMSHTDSVSVLPQGFRAVAHTDKCGVAAMCDDNHRLYGVQFHPEVTHTEYGEQVLRNFVFDICGCRADWKMDDFIERSVENYHAALVGKDVIMALSGGVDSSVASVLLHRAIGDRLHCIFVDHGLLRKDEGDFVERTLRLGAYPCVIAPGTTMERCYGKQTISERHRHRYEFNNDYRDVLRSHGLTLSGTSHDGLLVETVELTDRDFFVGVQYHLEFKSRPNKPHPLFLGFIGAALKRQGEKDI